MESGVEYINNSGLFLDDDGSISMRLEPRHNTHNRLTVNVSARIVHNYVCVCVCEMRAATTATAAIIIHSHHVRLCSITPFYRYIYIFTISQY